MLGTPGHLDDRPVGGSGNAPGEFMSITLQDTLVEVLREVCRRSEGRAM